MDRRLVELVTLNLASRSASTIFSKSSFAFILKEMNFVKCWLNQYKVDCKPIVLTSSTDNHFETNDVIKFSINLDATVARTFLDEAVGKVDCMPKLILESTSFITVVCYRLFIHQ